MYGACREALPLISWVGPKSLLLLMLTPPSYCFDRLQTNGIYMWRDSGHPFTFQHGRMRTLEHYCSLSSPSPRPSLVSYDHCQFGILLGSAVVECSMWYMCCRLHLLFRVVVAEQRPIKTNPSAGWLVLMGKNRTGKDQRSSRPTTRPK
jgi:hypothetical protein